MYYKLAISLAGVLMLLNTAIYAQDSTSVPLLLIKSNVISAVSRSLNIAAELSLSEKWSLHVPIDYNPWQYAENKKLKHIAFQPEIRRWLCQVFSGSFVGFHLQYAYYNAGGVKLPFGLLKEFKNYRYQGSLWGAGFSFGHQWLLNERWSVEAAAGAGYAYSKPEKFKCDTCGIKLGTETKNYIGPTKLSMSIVYVIR